MAKEKTEVKEEKKAEKPKEEKAAPKEEEKAEEAKETKKPRKQRIAVLNVFSSKNDTIITATDLTGAETLSWASGGMMVKAHREEGRPYAAMQATNKVVSDIKEKGITHVYIKIRGPGGNKSKTPASGAQSVVRTCARMGVRIMRIEDVTPLPTDSMKRKGGRRGRRV
ncbi:30S ribosomal protein S11 [Candidatus Micrarchaeota archaeon]|nr:30S ribosomal protein S11 [Candidatus Micrarchaeota archaeon]